MFKSHRIWQIIYEGIIAIFNLPKFCFFYTIRDWVVNDGGRFGSGEAISVNAYHVGIEFEGIVYCNVYPQGLTTSAWFNSLRK